jgi:hypothetical protein
MPEPRVDTRPRRARKLRIGALSLAALFFASALLLDLAYAFNGSLELFPTQEQQGKIEAMTLLAGFGLALAEVVILLLLWRLCACTRPARSPEHPHPRP